MRKLYRKVARQYGVKPAEVRAEIQRAVDLAWAAPPNDGVTAAWQFRAAGGRAGAPDAQQVIRWAAGEAVARGKKP